jgi:hypothetical protein
MICTSTVDRSEEPGAHGVFAWGNSSAQNLPSLFDHEIRMKIVPWLTAKHCYFVYVVREWISQCICFIDIHIFSALHLVKKTKPYFKKSPFKVAEPYSYHVQQYSIAVFCIFCLRIQGRMVCSSQMTIKWKTFPQTRSNIIPLNPQTWIKSSWSFELGHLFRKESWKEAASSHHSYAQMDQNRLVFIRKQAMLLLLKFF